MDAFYVGTKLIQAEPQEKDGQPGYAVRYPDGYLSWSPKAVFEETYLALGDVGDLQPHQQRVVAELRELEHRLCKLEAFLADPSKRALASEDEHRLLSEQVLVMADLHDILLERVRMWGVSNQWPD